MRIAMPVVWARQCAPRSKPDALSWKYRTTVQDSISGKYAVRPLASQACVIA